MLVIVTSIDEDPDAILVPVSCHCSATTWAALVAGQIEKLESDTVTVLGLPNCLLRSSSLGSSAQGSTA